MDTESVRRRFPRSSPYWPVLTHPRLRRVLPGLVISALGDGMSLVAISWLALQLAPAAPSFCLPSTIFRPTP